LERRTIDGEREGVSTHRYALRSDGAMLEEALKQVNVKVMRKEYEGATHDFFGAVAVLPIAKKAQSFAADQLKDAFKEQRGRRIARCANLAPPVSSSDSRGG
jgi:hypothetical protein